jgi:hypothetical protein
MMAAAPRDAVLSIRVSGTLGAEHWKAVSPRRLRELEPQMNVEIVPADRFEAQPRASYSQTEGPQLSLM